MRNRFVPFIQFRRSIPWENACSIRLTLHEVMWATMNTIAVNMIHYTTSKYPAFVSRDNMLLFRCNRQFQSPLSCRLYVALIIATNPISYSHEIEFLRIKNIIMLTGHLKELLRKPIVVSFLFRRVVHVRVFQILLAV